VVSHVRNVAANTASSCLFALTFALRLSLCASRDAVRSGRWQLSDRSAFNLFSFIGTSHQDVLRRPVGRTMGGCWIN
jgi:hypothetical protein